MTSDNSQLQKNEVVAEDSSTERLLEETDVPVGQHGSNGVRRFLTTATGVASVMVAAATWSHWAGGQDGKGPVAAKLTLEQQKQMQWAYMEPDVDREKCGDVEDNVDYQGDLIAEVQDIQSATMCCAVCAGYKDCRAWTWGKDFGKEGVGGHCWVKAGDFPEGGFPKKQNNSDVMSGLPHRGIKKFGVEPAMGKSTHRWDGVKKKDVDDDTVVGTTCPGKLAVENFGTVSLVNTMPEKPESTVEILGNDAVVSHMGARSYWADWCSEGQYTNEQYKAVNPLGKTISYTMDISGTGCGCNAAFYLVAMKQNTQVGTCNGDYYCDVMSVCGVPCIEIDLQEANQYSWRTTLHAQGDFMGKSLGYGGSRDAPIMRDWTSEEYSPGGKCIDTNKPFNVAISFPVDESGNLKAFEVELTQEGKDCPLKASITSYDWGWPPPQKDGWIEVTNALRAGMTPVMSYWKSSEMLWMDGLGEDGRGPCVQDSPEQCPDYVRFLNFSISDYKAAPSKAEPSKSSASKPADESDEISKSDDTEETVSETQIVEAE